MRTSSALAALASVMLLAGCRVSSADVLPPAAEAAPLHEAAARLTDVIVYDIFSPTQASRAYAYASVAAYEAVRHGDTAYRSLAGQVNGLAPLPAPPAGDSVSLPLAGVHAFLTVGRQLTFSRARMDSLRMAMDERFRRAGMPEAVYARSLAYGDTVATHVLAWAAADGYARSRGLPKYTVTSAAGTWVPTPPAYMDAVEPHWASLRPFAMDSAGQFRPAPPLPYDTARGSAFFREVLEVYDVGRTLTDEQRAIAAFWDCNPYVMHVQGHTMFATKKITPGGHWMSIVGLAARKADAGLVASAEAYARTAMALADGFIASWEEKFRSNLVRPETVINAYVDEQWQPLLQTPPFPEHTSGHSVISMAAATVLTDLFGDDFAFADSSEVPYGLPVREFASFREAAAQAAISRLYGGIHYRRAIEAGVVQGRAVGEHHLRRVDTRPGRRAPTTVAGGATASPRSRPSY
jgi:hypothetical protein